LPAKVTAAAVTIPPEKSAAEVELTAAPTRNRQGRCDCERQAAVTATTKLAVQVENERGNMKLFEKFSKLCRTPNSWLASHRGS